MKTKKILLPTDFSANARHAINYALCLFEKVPCRFHIINAVVASPSGLASIREKAKDTRLFQAVKSESEGNIGILLAELVAGPKNPLHTFAGKSIADSLLNAIGRATIDKDIDYIFMGTKGSSALKEVFMGSNTIKVLQNIDFCPVMAVPADYKPELPNTIVFATNFEHIYPKVALLPLMELAKISGAGITIIHVDKGNGLSAQQEAAKEALLMRFQGISHIIQEVVGYAKISEAIMSYSDASVDVGMVALVNTSHSFFEKLTRERVIRQIAFYTTVPVLVLPNIES